jgi:hypothetical protein
MAAASKKAGHIAYVSSDHDYMMTPKSFERSVLEAAEAGKILGIPTFTALEISICDEEANLVGIEAYRFWLKKKKSWDKFRVPEYSLYEDEKTRDIRYEMYAKKRAKQEEILRQTISKFECAVVLVHPHGTANPWIYNLFDGYEIVNAGMSWTEGLIAKLEKLMPGKRQFKGCDAHSSNWFNTMGECNEINFVPANEKELIAWIKTGESPKGESNER